MMDDSKVPGMSSKEQRFVYNSTFSVRKFYNVVFRKENARKMAKIYRAEHKEYVKNLENRNAILEYQNKALLNELKTLKALYKYRKDEQMDEWDFIFFKYIHE